MRGEAERNRKMRAKAAIVALLIVIPLGVTGWWVFKRRAMQARSEASPYTGSTVCRDCHAQFYEKWSSSWHGLAMQPYTSAFAQQNLTAQTSPIDIRGRAYRAEIGKDGAAIRELGPEGEKSYTIAHVLGGKNVFFFLTPMPGGKLQVLPLAFDSRRKEWYDTTGSMVRHLHEIRDEALDWTERPLTFNTSCYSCHVSQLSKNYSLENDTYSTTWGEPGINCESCHGPGQPHVAAMRASGDHVDKNKLEIIVIRQFDSAQKNSMCAPCHAKMSPLDADFQAGDRFFDHYNLVLLEDRDFYPDGRDLGENFTYTLWLISPCAASGKLDCVHCHTSSGRNRFTGADADKACLPCHARHVENPAAHSHHRPESGGSRCVACHMPDTTFARMRRHDHTMLPPSPSATLEFKSPNACNICHQDQDARWADKWVRKWYPKDYQAPLVHRGRLIEAARREDWARLDDMLTYITGADRNEVFAASLLRLLDRCTDSRKWPAVMKALRDPSPLVRSSAAVGFAGTPEPQALTVLVEAAGDPYRVVRVQTAMALSHYPLDSLDPQARQRVNGAFAEYEVSMRSQPDDPRSHYNLGNYHQEKGDLASARQEYEIALRLSPSFVPALVNLSLVHARLGEPAKTEWALREALRYSPASAEANFNLGLHLAERGRADEAEICLRTALKSDPTLGEAAYNLAVLVADSKPEETIALCRKAAQLRPREPRYAYTLAFYLRRRGDTAGAISTLKECVRQHPEHVDSIALLGSLYEESGRRDAALQLYRSAAANEAIPSQARQQFAELTAGLQRR